MQALQGSASEQSLMTNSTFQRQVFTGKSLTTNLTKINKIKENTQKTLKKVKQTNWPSYKHSKQRKTDPTHSQINHLEVHTNARQGPLFSPPLPLPPLHSLFHPSLSSEVNLDRGFGECCKLPQPK